MVVRKPLVMVGGVIRGLPAGDSINEGGGDVPEAPEDGKLYGRKNKSWIPVENPLFKFEIEGEDLILYYEDPNNVPNFSIVGTDLIYTFD